MIRFLFKGLIRDRTRSLFPTLTVVLGAMLTVIMYSWIVGAISGFVESSAKFTAGHVKIMSRAYAEEADLAPNDLAFIGLRDLLGTLTREYPDLEWTPRIRFGGLLDIPDENGETRAQGPVMGMGFDLDPSRSPERRFLNLDTAVVRGRLPEQPGEILLSDEFATRLEVGPGDTATLIGATMYGGMVVQNFTVSGTVRFGIAAMDRGALIADLSDVQRALDMDDAAGEILGFYKDSIYRNAEAIALREAFNARFEDDPDEFAPVMVTLKDQSGLAQTLDMASTIYTFVIVLFVGAMSIVLWNAGLMGSLRRYGEFGIRLALGEDRGHLYRSLIVEGLLIGIVGSVLGTGLGLAASYFLQIHGLDIGSMMKGASILIPDVMRARVTAASYVVGFIPGLMATFVGKAVSGIGVYKRQTSQLAKEFAS
jgi:putative ABC transport system permease protein